MRSWSAPAAGLEHATCHELRHTCLTRLPEAGWRWRRCRPGPGT
jgi:integrase